MRKEILDALTARFPGVSAAILGRIADRMAKTAVTAEDVKTAVDGIPFQQVLESYGDSRATEAQQTAVQSYEKKYGLKEGRKADGGRAEIEPEPNPVPDRGSEGLSKAIAAAVAAAMKPLQDDIAGFKRGRMTETRRQKLGTVIGRLPENLRKGYSRIQVDGLSDDEFDTLLGEVPALLHARQREVHKAPDDNPAGASRGGRGAEVQ